MMLKGLSFLIIFFLFVSFVSSFDFVPQNNISLRDNRTIVNWSISDCVGDDFVQGIDDFGEWVCVASPTGNASGDITSVQGDRYILNGSDSGAVNLFFNESLMNETIQLIIDINDIWVDISGDNMTGPLRINSTMEQSAFVVNSNYSNISAYVVEINAGGGARPLVVRNSLLDFYSKGPTDGISNYFFRNAGVDDTGSPVMLIYQVNETDDQHALEIRQDGTDHHLALVGSGLGGIEMNGFHIDDVGYITSNNWTNVTILEDQVSNLLHTVDTNETPRVNQLILSNISTNLRIDGLNVTVNALLSSNTSTNDKLDLVNTTTNIEGLGFVTGSHVVDTNCSGQDSCGLVAYQTDIPTSTNNLTNDDGYFNSIENFTGSKTDELFCTWDASGGTINCTSASGGGTSLFGGIGIEINATDNITTLLPFRLPQSCNDGEIAEYNTSSGGWDCAIDNSAGSGMASWVLASGDTGGSESITDGETVTFDRVSNFLTATRVTNTVTYTFNETLNNLTMDARDNDTTYINGSGTSLIGNQFNHSNTSGQSSILNNPNYYIQNITLDNFGHITSAASYLLENLSQLINDAGYFNSQNNITDVWVNESGDTMTGNLDMNNNSITAGDDLQANRFVITNGGDLSYIRISDLSDWPGSENAIVTENNELDVGMGDVVFLFAVQENKTSLVMQSGKNNSAGLYGNSLMFMPNTLARDAFDKNLTKATDCFEVYDYYNRTVRIDCDTSGYGASVIVQGGVDIWRELFVNDDVEIRGGDFSFFGNGTNDAFFSESSLRVFESRQEEVTEGGNITLLTETFGGGDLGVFSQTTTGGGTKEWSNTADGINCEDSPCATAVSGTTIIKGMATNLSTFGLTDVEVSFYYSFSANVDAGDSLVFYANNNSGSGDVAIATINGPGPVTVVFNESVLPTNMWNVSVLTLLFEWDGDHPSNEIVWVDTVVVNGTAGDPITFNVTRRDTKLQGFESTTFIFFNDTSDTWVFSPNNVSFSSVTEVDVNITTSLTVGGQTIFNFTDSAQYINHDDTQNIAGGGVDDYFHITSVQEGVLDSRAGIGDCSSGEFVQNTTTGGVECSVPVDTNTDTNASTACDGGQTYLNGDGGCDLLNDLSNFSNSFGFINFSDVEGAGYVNTSSGVIGLFSSCSGVEHLAADGNCYDAPAGNSKWVDNISFISPNSSFAINIVVPGYIKSNNWSNVTIFEDQVSDLFHTVDTNASTACSGGSTFLNGDGVCFVLENVSQLINDINLVNFTDIEAAGYPNTSAEVVSLFTDCDGTEHLRADGSCADPPAGGGVSDSKWVNATGDYLQPNSSFSINVNLTGNLSVGGDNLFMGNSDVDHFIYFYSGGDPQGERFDWDEGLGIFTISDDLTVIGLVSPTQGVVSAGDIRTTGSGDDFWLGSSLQSGSSWIGYADGSLEIGSGTFNVSTSGDLSIDGNITMGGCVEVWNGTCSIKTCPTTIDIQC